MTVKDGERGPLRGVRTNPRRRCNVTSASGLPVIGQLALFYSRIEAATGGLEDATEGVQCDENYYSWRSAARGSASAARMAGKKQAARAAEATRSTTPAKVRESVVETPEIWLARKRARA